MPVVFTKELVTEIGNKEFSFEEVQYKDIGTNEYSTAYNIRVDGENGVPIEFRAAINDNGLWKIIPQPLEDWIWKVETELGDAIENKNL